MKKRTRRLLLAGFILVLMAWVGVLALRPWVPRHRITAEGVGELREGMTAAEVEQVLGVPAGDYSSRKRSYAGEPVTFIALYTDLDQKEWVGDEVRVNVGFGPDGKAWTIYRSWPFCDDEDFLDQLRRLLHLGGTP